MGSYRKPKTGQSLGLILLFTMFGSAVFLGMGVDWSGPLLSEVNPNGTIDQWYLFDTAYERQW
jgi:hypothetical protein